MNHLQHILAIILSGTALRGLPIRAERVAYFSPKGRSVYSEKRSVAHHPLVNSIDLGNNVLKSTYDFVILGNIQFVIVLKA